MVVLAGGSAYLISATAFTRAERLRLLSENSFRLEASERKAQLEPSRPLPCGATRMGSLPVAHGSLPPLVSQVGSSSLPVVLPCNFCDRPAVIPSGTKPSG